MSGAADIPVIGDVPEIMQAMAMMTGYSTVENAVRSPAAGPESNLQWLTAAGTAD